MALDIAESVTSIPVLDTPDAALAAAAAVAAELAPGAADRERTDTSLLPQLQLVSRSGLLAVPVPTAHGASPADGHHAYDADQS